MKDYQKLTLGIVAAAVLCFVAVKCADAQTAPECKLVAEVMTDAAEQYADSVITVYKGEEAQRVIEVARAQSGRELEGADGAAVITSKEAGGGVILITKGGCVKLAGRGSFSVISAILEAAKVGGAT